MILKFICQIVESGQIKNRFTNFGNSNDRPPQNGIECEFYQNLNFVGPNFYSGFLGEKSMTSVCLIFLIIVTRSLPIRISINQTFLTLKIGFSRIASKMDSGHI